MASSSVNGTVDVEFDPFMYALGRALGGVASSQSCSEEEEDNSIPSAPIGSPMTSSFENAKAFKQKRMALLKAKERTKKLYSK